MKKILLILMLLLGAVTITSRPVQTYAYTDEQKQQAKDWLSAHGYAPTRGGAEQAYQDYLDGKIDVPEADAYLGKKQQKKVEEKKSSTANTKKASTKSGSANTDNTGNAAEETKKASTEASKENSEETTKDQKQTKTTTEEKATTETKQQQKQKAEKKKKEQKKEKKQHATGITIGVVAVAIFAILVVIMRKRM